MVGMDYHHEMDYIKNHWRNEFIENSLPPVVADLTSAMETLKADLLEKELRVAEISNARSVSDREYLAMQARLALLEADLASRQLAPR